eukprot:2952566-Rhodomonas_salina.2
MPGTNCSGIAVSCIEFRGVAPAPAPRAPPPGSAMCCVSTGHGVALPDMAERGRRQIAEMTRDPSRSSSSTVNELSSSNRRCLWEHDSKLSEPGMLS